MFGSTYQDIKILKFIYLYHLSKPFELKQRFSEIKGCKGIFFNSIIFWKIHSCNERIFLLADLLR